jgi:hypothetical protein
LAITYFTTRDDAFVYLFQHVKDIFRLRKLSIQPESLPPAEDLKKIERKHKSEQKKLPKQVDSLEILPGEFDC